MRQNHPQQKQSQMFRNMVDRDLSVKFDFNPPMNSEKTYKTYFDGLWTMPGRTTEAFNVPLALPD